MRIHDRTRKVRKYLHSWCSLEDAFGISSDSFSLSTIVLLKGFYEIILFDYYEEHE